VVRRITEAQHDRTLATDTTRKYHVDLDILFNYLESIAIGVSKGLYDKDTICDQMKPIIIEHVDDFILKPGATGKWKATGDDFEHLMNLYNEWKSAQ
jgi:hypothetical protein